MAEVVISIRELLVWAYDEYEDYTECKGEILKLKEDLVQLRILLDEYGDQIDCDKTNKKSIFHALLQLNFTVESAYQIHIRFSKKYKTKYQPLISVLFSRTKRHLSEIAGCREDLQYKINGLNIALHMTSYVKGNQVTNQEDTFSSNSTDSSAWEISYDDIKFKQDRSGNRKSLGSGVFATVYDATIQESPVAVKEFHCVNIFWNDAKKRKDFQKMFKQEIQILIYLVHPNIVEFVGAIANGSEKKPNFMIVVEKLSKTLTDIPQEMSLERKMEVILGIANGLAFMHSHRIIHGDIKPDNIMFSEDGAPKIIDFGLSKEKEHHQTTESTSFMSGALLWMSPERKKGESTIKSDVHSLGLVIAYFLTGTLPSKDMPPIDVYQEALKEATGNNEDICKLILQCFDENPDKRPIAVEVHFRLKLILRNLLCSKIEEEASVTNTSVITNNTLTDEEIQSVISRLKSISVNDIEEILSLSKNFEHSGLIQKESFVVLANATFKCPQSRVKIYSLDGIYTIISSLQLHRDDVNVQRYGLKALGNVMIGHPNHKVKVYKLSGIGIIISSLRLHPNDAKVQSYGLLALGNVMDGHPNHKIKAYKLNGIDTIISSLRLHPNDTNVQRYGLDALYYISSDQPKHVTEIVLLNGETLIQKAKEKFPNNIYIQFYGGWFLKQILK